MSETPQERAQRLMPLAYLLLIVAPFVVVAAATGVVVLIGWGLAELSTWMLRGGR